MLTVMHTISGNDVSTEGYADPGVQVCRSIDAGGPVCVTSDNITGYFSFPAVTLLDGTHTIQITDGTENDLVDVIVPGPFWMKTNAKVTPASKKKKSASVTGITIQGKTIAPNSPVFVHVFQHLTPRRSRHNRYAKQSHKDKTFAFSFPGKVKFPKGKYTFVLVYEGFSFRKGVALG